jgi:PAS domain S-box-containing protein
MNAMPQADSLRVLHLEDSAEDAELIANTLAKDWPDCRIDRVETRRDFLAALRREQFDLILSDYSVPDFGGLAALELARQEQVETPYIFLSGTIGEDRAVEALKLGATDYVIKDRPERLIPAVRRAVDETRERRRLRQAMEMPERHHEWFLQFAEQSNDVFWCAEFEPKRMVYVSPAFKRIWGIPAADLYRDPGVWERAIHPIDRSRVRSAWDLCLSGAQPLFEEEYRIVRPDGTERRVVDSGIALRDPAGRRVRMSGIVKDVTGRR